MEDRFEGIEPEEYDEPERIAYTPAEGTRMSEELPESLTLPFERIPKMQEKLRIYQARERDIAYRAPETAENIARVVKLDSIYKGEIAQELLNNGTADIRSIRKRIVEVSGEEIDEDLLRNAWLVMQEYCEGSR